MGAVNRHWVLGNFDHRNSADLLHFTWFHLKEQKGRQKSIHAERIGLGIDHFLTDGAFHKAFRCDLDSQPLLILDSQTTGFIKKE